jgi:thiol-disulfide isomerase/thioredoxin
MPLSLSPLPSLVLKVVLLAGGGQAESNAHSHAVHVRSLAALAVARGVPAAEVTIFWADGTEPGPDRAVVDGPPVPGEWILENTHLDAPTNVTMALENTEFPGFTVLPAKRDALKRFLDKTGGKLGPGDTLLLAVTDHGEPDPKDDRDTRITLWGERLSQSQLAADLSAVKPGARVVMWMSQCFSGGFAEIALNRPNTCGAFSANANQIAYGCFPELAGRTDVGHFVHMLDGLAARGTLAGASDWAMLRDDTPDQPHLASDLLLTDWLQDEAAKQGVTIDEIVDRGLATAPADAPERLLAARIAEAYALGPVPTQRAMGERLSELEDLLHAAETWRNLWEPALTSGRRWLAGPFEVHVKKNATRQEKRLVRQGFVSQLAALARAQPGLEDLMLAMLDHRNQADDAAVRLDTQAAAVLRIGDLFTRVAVPPLLPPEKRARYTALRTCETSPVLPGATGVQPTLPPPLPPLTETLSLIEAARPGYYGVRYEDQGEDDPAAVQVRRKGIPVGRGPVVAKDVTPGSPADKAGLRAGDRVLAVDAEPLTRPGRFRETAFFSRPGQVRTFDVERAGAPLKLSVVTAPFPLAPRALALGEPVETLPVQAYDTPLPAIGAGKPVVLVFWATWCKPCKASLPALGKWAAAHGAEVIAVTDESREVVAKFLPKFGPFPFPIALDPGGAAKALFAVEATPTFVVIDGRGRYADNGVGFDGEIPLRK